MRFSAFDRKHTRELSNITGGALYYVTGNIKRQSALSVKKTLDLISEKYGHTLLPEAAAIEEVANDEAVPDLLADERDYSGKSVVLDEGE